jgi:hypothetical protein
MPPLRKKREPKRKPFVIDEWMETSHPEEGEKRLVILQEREGTRQIIEAAFEDTVKDHLAGLSIIHRIKGYEKSLAFIRNKMPRPINIRSGDCGEILATEYIEQCTQYSVPIKRLRWKDDRDTAMRGDDVIGLRKANSKWNILKAESKSRASLGQAVVKQAIEGLCRHNGRPNPSSLAFISHRLREEDRDEEADVIEGLQDRTPRAGQIEHLIFTLSGNDPSKHLKLHLGDEETPRRHLVGCVIEGHGDFINGVFDRIMKG